MAPKAVSYMFQSKALNILTCIVGILAVSYGMVKDNDVLFIVGIAFAIGGYLLIRKRIKDYARKNLIRTNGSSEAPNSKHETNPKS
jgi:LPXTG-motif cell wall-anchored protein